MSSTTLSMISSKERSSAASSIIATICSRMAFLLARVGLLRREGDGLDLDAVVVRRGR